MSLYIIFLGIVPTLAFVSITIWYVRNNGGGKQWKKATASNPISTYVCCAPRRQKSFFKSQKPKNAKSSVEPNSNGKAFTISDRIATLPRDQIKIVKRDLVSTTNPEAINCSNEIEYRKSLYAAAATAADDVAVLNGNNNLQNDARNPSKRSSPLKTELGIKLAEHIMQLQRGTLQPKNFKGLTLHTDLKFEQLRESPNATPATAEILHANKTVYSKKPPPLPDSDKKPIASYDKKPPPPPPEPPVALYNKPSVPVASTSTNKVAKPIGWALDNSRPFYEKKPPPPPAPPQSLKPKKF